MILNKFQRLLELINIQNLKLMNTILNFIQNYWIAILIVILVISIIILVILTENRRLRAEFENPYMLGINEAGSYLRIIEIQGGKVRIQKMVPSADYGDTCHGLEGCGSHWYTTQNIPDEMIMTTEINSGFMVSKKNGKLTFERYELKWNQKTGYEKVII